MAGADFCRVAVGTGLRPIELRSIRTSDITESDIYVGKSFRVKTNFARKVPFDDPIAKEVIGRYTDPGFRESDPVLSKTDLVFGRSRMKELNRDLKKACGKVGAPELTVKEFRHLYAIRFLLRHKDDELKLLRLMRNMGHRNLSTTQNYLSYLPSDNVL